MMISVSSSNAAAPTAEFGKQQASSAADIRIESVNCPLCASNRSEVELAASDPSSKGLELQFQVVRCSNCGLHYTNPRPDPGSIARFYSADYRPHHGKAKFDRPLRGWYPLDWIQPPSNLNRRPRLLDFGCGGGHFLAAASRMGWEAAGLDVSASAVEAIRENLGLPAFVGSLPHDELETGSFDLMTMWHSLEHVHAPKWVLEEARRLLTPTGRLAIAVPNFDGWPRRVFGPDWFGLDLPRHLTHFQPATLSRMLDAVGLHVLEVRHPMHADWVRSSALLARGRGRSTFGRSMLRFKGAARVGGWLARRFGRSDAFMVLAERAN